LQRPATFSVTLVALPGVDGIKSFRALLKAALRRFGLRAIDVRELSARDEDERARSSSHHPPCSTRETSMSAFSERIRSHKKGFFKVADLEGGKERTLTIARLDEEVEIFGETKDILNFVETGQQLQLNQTTSEWLLNNLGDDPEKYPGNKVVLHLAEYLFEGNKKLGIRLKLPGAPALVDGPTRARPAADRKTDLDDEIPF
jgi:hypothetical protein